MKDEEEAGGSMTHEGVDSGMDGQQEVTDLSHEVWVSWDAYHGLNDLYQGGVRVSWKGRQIFTVPLLT